MLYPEYLIASFAMAARVAIMTLRQEMMEFKGGIEILYARPIDALNTVENSVTF